MVYEDEHVKPNEPIIIGFGDHIDRAELNLACIIFDRIACGASDTRRLAEKYGVPYPSYAIIRKFHGDSETAVSSIIPGGADVTIAGLLDFLRREAFPSVVEFTKENNDILFSPDRPGFQNHIIFAVDVSTEDGRATLATARELAPQFYGKCIFAYADLTSKSRYLTTLLADLEIDKSSPPLAIGVRSVENSVRFYRLEYEDWLLEGNAEHPKYGIERWIIDVLRGVAQTSKIISDQNSSGQQQPLDSSTSARGTEL